ncbi:hypothetical protein AB0K09_27185 [Streptomyces sp. NPDC049577]|uniref:hypothetical protein n=1 Tax=Streptomyces sp. NPDC049577 TaxID=3155153 RepID=UPI00343EC16D
MRIRRMAGLAVTPLALAALSTLGPAATHAVAAPADIDVDQCLDGGGTVSMQFGNDPSAEDFLRLICKGGTQDGQIINDG